jgi:hypothetical protein
MCMSFAHCLGAFTGRSSRLSKPAGHRPARRPANPSISAEPLDPARAHDINLSATLERARREAILTHVKIRSFRYCMLIGAIALGGVAIFYFANYVVLAIALANNGLEPFLKDSVRALWLAYACQSLLIALLYLLVAFKPHAVSREVIVLLGLLQLVEASLLFSFTGSMLVALLLVAAAVFVLAGAALWPKKLPEPVTSPPGSIV